jgi:hypothetical protein
MNRAYAVIDDFLEHRDHLDLWDAFQQTALSPDGAGAWNRVYRLMDGEEPASTKSRLREPSLQDGTIAGSPPAPPPLRLFSEKLSILMTGDAPPIAVAPWTGFSQSAWIYRPNTGLEWHSDTGWLAGYIYYAHPAWRSSWGGELLVGTDDTPSVAAPPRSDEPQSAREAVCRTGGVFIYPHPNRLVLLRGGIMHCIKKVESTAGNAFRASVSGFFFNTDGTGASD